MRICVTGVAGMIGSHLADALIAAGHDVWGIDNLSGGHASNVPDQAFWFQQDCRAGKWIPDTDVLIHCAALPHEGLSLWSPRLISDNVFGASVAMFSTAIANGVKRICFLSSMARYGDQSQPFTEDMRPRPVDVYAVAKVASEQTLRCLGDAHGVEWNVAVPHSVIGERQRIDPFRNVATIFANRMLRGLPPIVYGDGQQTRSFSYVSDVVGPIVKMATSGDKAVLSQVINVGPDEETTSINDLVEMMRPMCGYDGEAIYAEPRQGEVRHATCSSEKARKLLGYRTSASTFQALERLVCDIKKRGPRPFDYHLPIEINGPSLPSTWRDKSL